MLGRNGEDKRQINTFRRSERAGTRDQEPAILQVSRIGDACGVQFQGLASKDQTMRLKKASLMLAFVMVSVIALLYGRIAFTS